jgi:hypothetical protein
VCGHCPSLLEDDGIAIQADFFPELSLLIDHQIDPHRNPFSGNGGSARSPSGRSARCRVRATARVYSVHEVCRRRRNGNGDRSASQTQLLPNLSELFCRQRKSNLFSSSRLHNHTVAGSNALEPNSYTSKQ